MNRIAKTQSTLDSVEAWIHAGLRVAGILVFGFGSVAFLIGTIVYALGS